MNSVFFVAKNLANTVKRKQEKQMIYLPIDLWLICRDWLPLAVSADLST